MPYEQIKDVADSSREVRAFIFNRNKDLYVVYWHIARDKKLDLPLNSNDIILQETIGNDIPVQSGQDGNNSLLPAGKVRYIKTSKLTKDQLITAFKNAKVVD